MLGQHHATSFNQVLFNYSFGHQLIHLGCFSPEQRSTIWRSVSNCRKSGATRIGRTKYELLLRTPLPKIDIGNVHYHEVIFIIFSCSQYWPSKITQTCVLVGMLSIHSVLRYYPFCFLCIAYAAKKLLRRTIPASWWLPLRRWRSLQLHGREQRQCHEPQRSQPWL